MTAGERTTAKRIAREDLKKKLDRGDAFILVDTLPPTAYRKRHLPHAINIPSDDIIAMAPRVIPDRQTEIVVYCANGPCRRSGLAAERLAALGYTNVRDYHDGRRDWQAAGWPVQGDDE